MIKQKRGVIPLTLFKATELILLGISIALLLVIATNLAQTTYEKSFISRDIALVIGTIYASPEDVEYVYSMEKYDNKFDVEIDPDGHVRVYDSGYKSPQAYEFSYMKDEKIPEFRASGPSAIKFVKKGGVIEVTALS